MELLLAAGPAPARADPLRVARLWGVLRGPYLLRARRPVEIRPGYPQPRAQRLVGWVPERGHGTWLYV